MLGMCLLVADAETLVNETLNYDVNNVTTKKNDMLYANNEPVTAEIIENSEISTDVKVSAGKHCSLVPKNYSEMIRLKEMLHDGIKMIKYNLVLDDRNTSILEDRFSDMFRPFHWVKVSGRQGAGLLLLREHFDILSLYMLAIGVREFDIELTEMPKRCLATLEELDIQRTLREAVMSGFNSTGVDDMLGLKSTDRVCNLHIRENEGYADFRYFCCQRNEQDQVICEYLQEDVWVSILFYIIWLLKVMVLLFGPLYIPGAYYRLKYLSTPYVHNLAESVKLSLNIVLTKHTEKFRGDIHRFKLSKFKHMTEFKETIQNLKHDVPYKIDLKDIHLKSKYDRLLPEHFVPVGLLSTLYDSFVKCKIRKNSALKACCATNVCIKSPCNLFLTWFTLCRKIMTVVVSLAIITPWILRVALYFFYEHEETDMRKRAAADRNLQISFPGNITQYLTPVHIVFICIYVLLCLEFCFYGVLSERVKEQLKFVLRKCFRDMRERDRGEVIGWAVRTALQPCTKYGGFGICVGAFAWVLGFPFMIAILAFYLLPTLNLTLRLWAHLMVYIMPRNICKYFCCQRISEFLDCFEREAKMDIITNSESLEKNENILKSGFGRLQQILVILFSFISLYSVLFLLTEIVSVVVEVIIYTLMGIILNAAKTLSYVSLLFLLGVYAHDCFGNVSKKFLAFNKVLNGAILSLGKKKCEEVMYLSPKSESDWNILERQSGYLTQESDKQDNMAFILNTATGSVLKNPVRLIQTCRGRPRWQVNRLVLFFSKFDIPQIPKSFFFDACKMPFNFLPGKVLTCYFRAVVEFGIILMFLIFVLLVVLAFGDTYKISTSNQLLATVAGGLLPLLLQKVFRKFATPDIDKDSIQFRVFLHELLENFKQSWPIYDIVAHGSPTIVRSHSVKNGVELVTEKIDFEPDSTNNHVVNADENAGSETQTNGQINAQDKENTGQEFEMTNFSELESETLPLTGEGLPNENGYQYALNEVPIDMLIDINEIDTYDFPNMETPSINGYTV